MRQCIYILPFLASAAVADPMDRLEAAIPEGMYMIAFEDAEQHWPHQTNYSSISVTDMDALREITQTHDMLALLGNALFAGWDGLKRDVERNPLVALTAIFGPVPKSVSLIISFDGRSVQTRSFIHRKQSAADAHFDMFKLEPNVTTLNDDYIKVGGRSLYASDLDVLRDGMQITTNGHAEKTAWLTGETARTDQNYGDYRNAMGAAFDVMNQFAPDGATAIEVTLHHRGYYDDVLEPGAGLPHALLDRPPLAGNLPRYFGMYAVDWRKDNLGAAMIVFNHFGNCEGTAPDILPERWDVTALEGFEGDELVTAQSFMGDIAAIEHVELADAAGGNVCLTIISTEFTEIGPNEEYPEEPDFNYLYYFAWTLIQGPIEPLFH